MESDSRRKQQTQQSFTQIDFVPPEHSYITNQQFSSAFYKDHGQEQYQIHQAFNASNFTYLRKNIPNQLKHGAILDLRLQKAQNNIHFETIHRQKPWSLKEQERQSKIGRQKMQQVGQLGYFQTFPYQQSLYGVQHEGKLRQQQDAKQKQESISVIDFRPAGFDRKLKYQNPFSYVDRIQGARPDKEKYIFPFHIPEDTYDRFHQSELRQRIIQDSYKIAGDFIPATNEKSLTKINRSKAAQILKQLQQYIKQSIPNTGFFIGMSKRDHLDILFDSKQCQNSKLQLLMSRICESEQLSKYLLRRNTFKWGRVAQSGYLEFSVLPQWVKDPQQKLVKQ